MKKYLLEHYDKQLLERLHQTTRGNYFHYWYDEQKCFLVVRLK